MNPQLGRGVTSVETAQKVRALEASDRLDHPINLKQWFPDRPYASSPHYIREMEAYYNALDAVYKDLEQYDAVLLVGGSGPIVDMVNNHRIHDLILGFYKLNHPIATECYAVACLAFARDRENRKSLISGKHVTGHCLEYDYKDGTGFMGVDFNMGPPPYPLEYILRDATAPDGRYHGNVGKKRFRWLSTTRSSRVVLLTIPIPPVSVWKCSKRASGSTAWFPDRRATVAQWSSGS